jgi:hypothetical protein
MGCLVAGHRVRPGPGTADRTAHLHPLQDRNELRAVTGLAGREDERQRAAAPVGRKMDLAGQPAPGTPQFSGSQAGPVPSADASALGARVTLGLSVLRLPPLRSTPFSASKAISRAANCSGSRAIPAAW